MLDLSKYEAHVAEQEAKQAAEIEAAVKFAQALGTAGWYAAQAQGK